MQRPEMKPFENLSQRDFERAKVWVYVRYHDQDEPWFEEADERTVRPWTGPLPFVCSSQFGFGFVSASFELADGTTYPGYFAPVREDWDTPLPPRKMKDGNFTKPHQWSARRGGTPLSVLALHKPIIFLQSQPFDFRLRRDVERRKLDIQNFYSAVGKPPHAVFPVRFEADAGLANGVIAGLMHGFFSFPLDKPYEIETGESPLTRES